MAKKIWNMLYFVATSHTKMFSQERQKHLCVIFTMMLGDKCPPVSYRTVNHCICVNWCLQVRVLTEGSASSEGSLWGLLGLKWGSSQRAPCRACPDAWRCPFRSPQAATVPVSSAVPLKRSWKPVPGAGPASPVPNLCIQVPLKILGSIPSRGLLCIVCKKLCIWRNCFKNLFLFGGAGGGVKSTVKEKTV